MKLRKLKCPNCGGSLDINIDDVEYIFCPFCGEKFFVEDGKKEYTINQNISIKKDINKRTEQTHHSIDEADVIRAKTEDREQKNTWKYLVGCFAVLAIIMGICFYMAGAEDRAVQQAIESGKISAGSYKDYKGEHYEAVVEQLEALGFEDIVCVDLDDSGVLFWRAEKVESVSISGDTVFDKNDYRELIGYIKSQNKKCRIAIVSLKNYDSDPQIEEINKHLKYIADSEQCEYGDIATKKVWNPKATIDAVSFVYSIGFVHPLKNKRPLYDLVKSFFCYE